MLTHSHSQPYFLFHSVLCSLFLSLFSSLSLNLSFFLLLSHTFFLTRLLSLSLSLSFSCALPLARSLSSSSQHILSLWCHNISSQNRLLDYTHPTLSVQDEFFWVIAPTILRNAWLWTAVTQTDAVAQVSDKKLWEISLSEGYPQSNLPKVEDYFCTAPTWRLALLERAR